MGTYYDSYLTFANLPESFRNAVQPYIGQTTVPSDANALVANFVNMCAKQIMTRYEFLSNDFEKFYRGALPVGGYIQESYVLRLACREKTDKNTTSANRVAALLDPSINESNVGYFKLNKSYAYKVTTEEDVTKEAFTSPEALAEFIANQLATPFESLKADRYAVFKNFLQKVVAEVKTANTTYAGDIVLAGTFDPQGIAAADQQNALQFILAVKNLAASFDYDSTAYNAAKVVTNSKGKKLTVFMKSSVKKAVEVLIASGAYNMALVDLNNFDIIEVDDLGDVEDKTTQAGKTIHTVVGAIIIDDRAIRHYASYERSGAFYNPENGYTNTFLSAQDLLGYARWANVGRVSFQWTTTP